MARRNWEWFSGWQRPDRLALRLVALTWAAGRERRRPGASPEARKGAADQEPASAWRAASS